MYSIMLWEYTTTSIYNKKTEAWRLWEQELDFISTPCGY